MNEQHASATKVRGITGVSLVLVIIAINSYCTQFVASRLAYHASLGEPMFGNYYSPFAWWRWAVNFREYAPTTYNYAALIFLGGVFVSLFVYKAIVGFVTRSSRKHPDTHGTAHFATLDEVKKSGLMDQKQGVYCGGYDHPKTGRTHYLRHNGPEHICVIAPPRSGKGVGLIVPTLLSWPDSVVVLDIKGENDAMTSGCRKELLNNIVLRFDPANRGNSCSWNPLGEIRFRTHYQISDAQNIAHMVIDSDGKGLTDHWKRGAFQLLGGVIMHALMKSDSRGRTPCLKDCAEMLKGTGGFAAPPVEFDDGESFLMGLFVEMQNVPFDEGDSVAREAALFIQGIGRSMAGKPSKELDSIISSAGTELALYEDPTIGENTSRNDFMVSDLMDCDRPVSLYLITTPDDLPRLTPLIRIFITRMIMGLTGQMTFDDGRSKTAHKHRLLLMLDEFPSLGRLDVFEKALAYIAGYGIKAYIITQDIQQLYKAYTVHESILSNCHIQIAYAPNKLETAEWLSKMTGQTTVVKEQISTSGKRFNSVATNFSRSYQDIQRPLMTSHEVRSLAKAETDGNGNILKAGEMLIFAAGMQVILGRQILYFKDPTFSKRSKIAPPAKSDIVRSAP